MPDEGVRAITRPGAFEHLCPCGKALDAAVLAPASPLGMVRVLDATCCYNIGESIVAAFLARMKRRSRTLKRAVSDL